MDDLQKALGYLKRTLPVADRLTLTDGALERVARHALDVRARTGWGASVPEDVFRAYVLFPRVNNEDPAFYHEAIWRELGPRIAGKTMARAALEVNYWCAEKATYQSTDDRTANPLTVIRRGFGRCGEESVLLVAALRACCIPARQVYVPRWAHCDDNHAWAEVWADGDWHYLGACEPEPVLDSGWFTAAASKAMLVHTRAFDSAYAAEPVVACAGGDHIINRTAAYAVTERLAVRVARGGAPLPGITVRFELANMAEWYPIHQAVTDTNGEVSLVCGLGTLRLHAHDGRRYVCRMADTRREAVATIDFGAAVPFEEQPSDFAQFPPRETRIQPDAFPPAVNAAHEQRLRACAALRAAAHPVYDGDDEFLREAYLNRDEIKGFLDDGRFAEEDKRALLGTLSRKDLSDISRETLADALEMALPSKPLYPRDIWVSGVLCPRAACEMLYPVRKRLRELAGPLADAREVWRAIVERTRLTEAYPPTLCPDLSHAFEGGLCSAFMRDVLYVALARANGVAARLNPVTGEKEFYADGAYRALLPARAAEARVTLVNASGGKLLYGVDFTLGALEGGAYRTLELYGQSLEGELTLPLAAGRYRLMVCTRQIDGEADGRLTPFAIASGETARVDVAAPGDKTAGKLLREPLPPLEATLGERRERLPQDLRGQPGILAFLHPGQEPTEHFLNELIEAKDALDGIAVRLIVDDPALLGNEKLRLALEAVPAAETLHAPDHAALTSWRRLMRAGDLRLPFALAADGSGAGLFAFTNYHVGSVLTLARMLAMGR